MIIKCTRPGKTKGLTENKLYKVSKETFDGYIITNDNNIKQLYKKNRFEK